MDQALARHSGIFCPEGVQAQEAPKQYLTPQNAAQLYWEARSKGLGSFQAACASYSGAHMAAVSDATPLDPLAPVLKQAAKYARVSAADLQKNLAVSPVFWRR